MLTADAHDLANHMLGDCGQRLRHSAGVAARSHALAVTVPTSAVDMLVAAAWLHDIGYAPILRDTDFHPLDGAVYLRREGWPDLVCNLVAHHSGSRFLARVRGLEDRLNEFTFAEDAVSDALTAADNTAGPDGGAMHLDERLREKGERHRRHSPIAQANPQRNTYIHLACRRVAERLTALGQRDPQLPH